MAYSVPQPTITYRHLVSAGSLNAANPLRVVSLCDIDAAYAAFEAKRLGIDPFVTPVAVQQWQGLIAVSYAARAYGITRHEDIDAARKKCPDLVAVHVATYAEGAQKAEYNENPRSETHKVSLDPYRRESRKVVAIFNEMCPLGAIEKASIDEMYCDLTLAVRQVILQRFPHLAKPPADSPDGLDTPLPEPPKIDWTNLGHRMPTEEAIAAESADEPDATASEAPSTEPAANWTDYALACGAELIYKVRSAVLDRLGYTMSAGIASNKTLAKLCAGERKPNNQTVMPTSAVPVYLKNLPFQKIRFLGGKLGDAIASEWASSTVGDLWSVPLAEMQTKFGDESRWVYDVLRGIDHSAVIERTKNKTMLASKNVKPPIRTTAEATRWLSILSLELCVRLREAREEAPNLWPSTLVLRFLKPFETARSRQAAFPYVRDFQPQHILNAAEKLWAEALGEQAVATNLEVITIALGFSGLEAGEQGQRSIEGFFAGGPAANAPRPPPVQSSEAGSSKAAAAAEEGAAVAGGTKRSEPDARAPSPLETKVTAATASTSMSPPPPTAVRKTKKAKPNGLVSLFQKAAASQMQASQSRPAAEHDAGSGHATSTATEAAAPQHPGKEGLGADRAPLPSDGGRPSAEPVPPDPAPRPPPSWVCPSCSQRIYPRPRPTPSAPTLDNPQKDHDGEDGAEEEQRRLRLAQQDHEDYHFAMELQREDGRALMPVGSLSSQQVPGSSQRGPPASQRGPPSSQRGKGQSKKNARPVGDFFKRRGGGAS